MSVPLTALECELLEGIARGDATTPEVLADYWLEHGNEARGAFVHLHHGENAERLDLADEETRLAAFAAAWRLPVIEAGYPEDLLMLVDGFLQFPLSIPADHPLDGHPDIVRISPRYYREERLLRDGVDCMVYEAQAITPRTRTRVAIKAAGYDDGNDLIDYEYTLLRGITHPNIVRLISYVVRPNGRALALAWCGQDLRKLVASARANERALGLEFALSVGIQLLDALVALHAAQITHGEVRSEHVTVTSDGVVTLIDFGFARTPELAPPRPDFPISPPRRGDTAYRIRYMSPEQARGRRIDTRTDVFSAAGLICELIGNEHPIQGPNDMALLMAIVQQDTFPPPLPPQLEAPLVRAFERDRANRISAAELRTALVDAARTLRIPIGPHVIAEQLLLLGVPT